MRTILLLGIPPLVVLSALARLRPPDGREHAPLIQFAGRFHPLVVHFPIALLALALLMEAAGRRPGRATLREAAGFVLGFATIAAYVAAGLGWMLAWSGGFRGHSVILHLWAGIWLCLACLVCAALRRPGPAGPGARYVAALAITVVLMAWTGHLGGKLSHGDDYLTHYLPGRIRRWVGLAPLRPPAPRVVAAPAGPAAFYEDAVAPLLEKHCVGCHGPDKQKGKLRLDGYDAILSGGKDGPVIAAGDPGESEMYRRITLPPDDDDFMPSNDKPPLSAAEVAVIERWIAGGARRLPGG